MSSFLESRGSQEKKVDEVERISKVDTGVTKEEDIVEASEGGGEGAGEKKALWRNVKRYRKVVWVSFGIASVILLYGYDNVVVGTVSGMPKFQEDFGTLLNDEWILPSSWLALWNVASPIGGMLGSLLGGFLSDRLGRRSSLATSSFLSALAVAVMFVSYLPSAKDSRRACFLVGKFFQGTAIGAAIASAQTYMSEILPPVLRGSGMAFFPAFTLLGQLTGALVIYGSLGRPRGYVVAFGSQWPFSFVPIIIAFLIPESPAWYVRRGAMEKAMKAQARLDPAGTDTKALVDKIAADIEHERQSTKATYAECFQKGSLRRTFIVAWANALTAVFGLPLLAKASYFLQIVGMKPNTSIVFLILGIVLGLLANFASVWVVARCGRRPLILSSLGVTALLWLSSGVANCFEGGAVVWWTAVSMMLTIIVCGLAVWPASFAVSAETSALQLRAKTQGVGWFVSAFSSAASGIALPYIFNPDAGNLRGKVAFTYVGSCVLGVIVSWWVVPEMKGRTVAEIDRMFEVGLGAREFRGWRDGDNEEMEGV